MIGAFDVRIDGRSVPLSPTSQRLVALLGLRATTSRPALAGTLWPERSDHRATANLRSTVWRLPAALRSHVVSTSERLALGDGWILDTREASDVAQRLWDGLLPSRAVSSMFCADLLPSWDEGWLEAERERYHQLRLHALEQLSRNHLAAGRPDLALDFGLQAVEAEPLRETARYLVLEAYLGEGNRAEAIDHFHRFETLLLDELGVAPGPTLAGLMGELIATGQVGVTHR